MEPKSSLDTVTAISEIARNFAAVLAFGGALFAWWKWRKEKYDRSTDVLLKLDERFNGDRVRNARALIEDDTAYGQVRGVLKKEVSEGGRNIADRRKQSGSIEQKLVDLDEMLRFYVVLYGVRQAHQVPDAALSACFRFWLTQYFNPKRVEFAHYVDEYFPTLQEWIHDDFRRYRSKDRRFFTPEHFKWKDELPRKDILPS